MSSLSDFIQMPSGTPTGLSYVGQTPHSYLNSSMPAINENEAIAQNRLNYDFSKRTLPDMVNASAAQGNWGSSGTNRRIGMAALDKNRQYLDVARAAALQRASIAQQNVQATFGGMF